VVEVIVFMSTIMWLSDVFDLSTLMDMYIYRCVYLIYKVISQGMFVLAHAD